MADRNNVLINSDNRIFYLSDEIEVNTMSQINFQLIKLLMTDDQQEKEKKEYKREPIHIFINSYGGSTYDMWSLIDLMISSKTPIYTYCTGYAMSSAFLIFLAGKKRFSTKHTTFLYHQASDWLGRKKYQDLVEITNESDFAQSEIEDFVIKRTKILKEQLEEIRFRKKDWYIHTPEALELGIVTHKIEEETD